MVGLGTWFNKNQKGNQQGKCFQGNVRPGSQTCLSKYTDYESLEGALKQQINPYTDQNLQDTAKNIIHKTKNQSHFKCARR